MGNPSILQREEEDGAGKGDVMCPHCGWKFLGEGVVPKHMMLPGTDNQFVCPGSGQKLKGSGKEPDPVNPPHYKAHPSGIQCIEITRHMGFNLGNVVKYVWRADLAGNDLEDLNKARWYIEDEIKKREQQQEREGKR